MDASKVPVKLVKVTRVLGRTGKLMLLNLGVRVGNHQRRDEEIQYTNSSQAREVVSLRSAWNSWMIRREASFAMSRALVSD